MKALTAHHVQFFTAYSYCWCKYLKPLVWRPMATKVKTCVYSLIAASAVFLMNFKEKLQEFTHSLVTTKDYRSDVALQRVVQILKKTKTERELKKNVSLISRISIDSVEDWDTINKISAFLKPYS